MRVQIEEIKSSTLTDSFYSDINENFRRLRDAIDTLLARDIYPDSPNGMNVPLDLNGNRAINAGSPVNALDLVNKEYVDNNFVKV